MVAKVSLLFTDDGEALGTAIEVQTNEGPLVVETNWLSVPIAIIDSPGYGDGAQQAVVHTRSGIAFRREMTEDAAQALANDLVSGIGVTWDLNWTQIADIPTEELAALLGLLASHPDDYFGSVRATLSTETTDGIEVYLCPAGDTPS